MPVQFLDLPPVERSGSLHGYYIIPSIGSYSASIRMSGEDSILAGLRPLDPNTPGYVDRGKAAQDLRPWDDSDLKRLQLSLSLSRNVEVQMQEPLHNEEANSFQKGEFNPLEMIKRS